MRKYRVTALSAVIFVAAMFCASHTSLILIPGFFLLLLIPQVILLGLQCYKVVCNWEKFRKAECEEICEKVQVTVVYRKKYSYTPFAMTRRAFIVMLGINPDRAGPSFVIL